MSRLVSRYEHVAGGKEVRIHLKDDLRWSDGEALTAADLCFTVDAIMEALTKIYGAKRVVEELLRQ